MKPLADALSSFFVVVSLSTPCSGLWWVPLVAINCVNPVIEKTLGGEYFISWLKMWGL